MTIVCLIVHGVEFSKDFANKWKKNSEQFICNIRKEIKQESNLFYFDTVNWNNLVAERENQTKSLYWDWSYQKLIDVMSYGATDIIWYSSGIKSDTQTTFNGIHDIMESKIDSIVSNIKGEFKIVLIGHSWGTQINFNHAYLSKHKSKIIGFVTMGSPILWGSGRFENWGDIPNSIRFWLNFYSRYDIISGALSRNPNKEWAIIKDIDISTRYNFMEMLPLRAHASYWNNPTVIEAISTVLNHIS